MDSVYSLSLIVIAGVSGLGLWAIRRGFWPYFKDFLFGVVLMYGSSFAIFIAIAISQDQEDNDPFPRHPGKSLFQKGIARIRDVFGHILPWKKRPPEKIFLSDYLITVAQAGQLSGWGKWSYHITSKKWLSAGIWFGTRTGSLFSLLMLGVWMRIPKRARTKIKLVLDDFLIGTYAWSKEVIVREEGKQD